MKSHLFAALLLSLIPASGLASGVASPPLSPVESASPTINGLVADWTSPFQAPPFEQITLEHYLPAFERAMDDQRLEIVSITAMTGPATFENTIEALEKSGRLLKKVNDLFQFLNGANTSDGMQKLAKEIAPRLAKHTDDINLNPALFARVKAVYDQKETLPLSVEQKKVLKDWYDNLVRGGANLTAKQQEQFRKNNEELSVLTVKFAENLLKETNAVALIVEKKEDLAGLPEHVIQAALDTGKAKGHEGKWVFTLQKPSFLPALQYAENRKIRETLFKAYIRRGNNGNDADNKGLLARVAALRLAQANLLGYKTHADFVLEKNMAKTPDKVYAFLRDLWGPAVKRARAEAADMQKIIDRETKPFKLEAWDWAFYAEKVKKEKYNLDEEMLRPYFKLENVLQGVRDLATRLYGITFTERIDIPVWHPDVKVLEVKEADGRHLALLYTDYFPRDNKKSGAWMSSFRKQSKVGGEFVTPLIINVGNFSKPSADKPSLLRLDEVLTLFHEFGHALHGMLSNSTYPSITGTSVPRDFVELPSQIMENWAIHPEVLKLFAKHYQTGEAMPEDLIKKIENSRLFNQGFANVEFLAAALLDMDWHTLTTPEGKEVEVFERESLTKTGLIPEIESRYQSTNFQHIFAGGYSAGYYSYLWAAVLDADAFEAFKEKGIFDKPTATAFRTHVLEKGGSDDPMTLYKNFRGREPKPDAFLTRSGLKE